MNNKNNDNCPLCGQCGIFSHYYESESNTFKIKRVLICSSCSFSWSPDITQKQLDEYYRENYDLEDFQRSKLYAPPEKYFQNEKNQFKPWRSKRHLKIAKKVLKKEGISILDIGAGLGTTLFWAKDVFKDPVIYGFENDKNAIKYLEHIKANVITGNMIGCLRNIGKQFDLIICSQFLEHVASDSLNDFVQVLHVLLKEDGILLIEVPHNNWVKYPSLKYSNPPHVGFYSVDALKILFKDFKIYAIGTTEGPLASSKNTGLQKLIKKIYSKISKFRKISYTLNGKAILIIAGLKK